MVYNISHWLNYKAEVIHLSREFFSVIQYYTRSRAGLQIASYAKTLNRSQKIEEHRTNLLFLLILLGKSKVNRFISLTLSETNNIIDLGVSTKGSNFKGNLVNKKVGVEFESGIRSNNGVICKDRRDDDEPYLRGVQWIR
ncbi:MAG: hypothetical protein L6308_00840 [Candidatus Omnitrophica bacterium]|nr:hypothetical protein [Candidatus Omnitrophota bacterium]MCG2713382.1 hypothetical protein [Candidatus Omnitrophota bacterium]